LKVLCDTLTQDIAKVRASKLFRLLRSNTTCTCVHLHIPVSQRLTLDKYNSEKVIDQAKLHLKDIRPVRVKC